MAVQPKLGETCPSPTPWEAGCTWSRRKEGEEVRLQEFPGALYSAEIMGDERKEGGGADDIGNEGPLAPKKESCPASPQSPSSQLPTGKQWL